MKVVRLGRWSRMEPEEGMAPLTQTRIPRTPMRGSPKRTKAVHARRTARVTFFLSVEPMKKAYGEEGRRFLSIRYPLRRGRGAISCCAPGGARPHGGRTAAR